MLIGRDSNVGLWNGPNLEETDPWNSQNQNAKWQAKWENVNL